MIQQLMLTIWFAADAQASLYAQLYERPLLFVTLLTMALLIAVSLLRSLFGLDRRQDALPEGQAETPTAPAKDEEAEAKAEEAEESEEPTEAKAEEAEDTSAEETSEAAEETEAKAEETAEKVEAQAEEKVEATEETESKTEEKEEPKAEEKVEAAEETEAKAEEKEEKKAEATEEKAEAAEETEAKVEEKEETEAKAEEKAEAAEETEAKAEEKEEKKAEASQEEEEEEVSEAIRKRRERSAALRARRRMRVQDMEVKDDAPVAEESASRSLRDGVTKMRSGWISRLNNLLLGKKKLGDDLLDELEEILYSADIGTHTTQHLLQKIEEEMDRNSLKDAGQVKEALKKEIREILTFEKPQIDFAEHHPYVMMVVGVNGVGKTTTIGKVAARLSKGGKKVLLAAGDTFRAAAVEQLEIWANQVDADFVKGQPNQDPSSVVFDGIKAAVARKVDVAIADTAGRLHTQQNLMEELKKVRRVIAQSYESAPHETLLVLDATTGQNALNQAKEFNEALGVTGIALTKLDGTAKGGIVVAISKELKIPIRYVGVGEHIDELKSFSAHEFVDALFD